MSKILLNTALFHMFLCEHSRLSTVVLHVNTYKFMIVNAAAAVAVTGFHEFAEFVAEDVGTVDSGLNSMVLANNNEMVLLPVNEPTFGTPRKSQIQVGALLTCWSGIH